VSPSIRLRRLVRIGTAALGALLLLGEVQGEAAAPVAGGVMKGAWRAGQEYVREARYREAVSYLKNYLGLRPRSADGWFWLGRALECSGEYDRAQFAYRKALEADPDYPPLNREPEPVSPSPRKFSGGKGDRKNGTVRGVHLSSPLPAPGEKAFPVVPVAVPVVVPVAVPVQVPVPVMAPSPVRVPVIVPAIPVAPAMIPVPAPRSILPSASPILSRGTGSAPSGSPPVSGELPLSAGSLMRSVPALPRSVGPLFVPPPPPVPTEETRPAMSAPPVSGESDPGTTRLRERSRSSVAEGAPPPVSAKSPVYVPPLPESSEALPIGENDDLSVSPSEGP
jgi:hypothetical protein